jgi:hypothetical protein
MTRYHFAFISSYQGDSDYYVYNQTADGRSRISVRHTILDCVAKTCASQEIFNREIVPTVGTVRGDRSIITPAMLAAFHAWRMDRHAQDMQIFERAGVDYDATLHPAPALMRGAYWDEGAWVYVDPA